MLLGKADALRLLSAVAVGSGELLIRLLSSFFSESGNSDARTRRMMELAIIMSSVVTPAEESSSNDLMAKSH